MQAHKRRSNPIAKHTIFRTRSLFVADNSPTITILSRLVTTFMVNVATLPIAIAYNIAENHDALKITRKLFR